MTTLYEYENDITWSEKLPLYANWVCGESLVDIENELIIKGVALDLDTVVAIAAPGESIDEAKIIRPQSIKSASELKISWTPTVSGINTLVLSNGDRRSNALALTVTAPKSQNDALSNTGWLKLDSSQELEIVDAKLKQDKTPYADTLKADIIQKPQVELKRNTKGAYLDGTGYAAFSALKWDRSSKRTVDFILSLSGARSFYLGICSVEKFKWNGTDRLSSEIAMLINRDRFYYFYGGEYRLFSYPSYAQVPRRRLIRLSITNNGFAEEGQAQVYVLPKDATQEQWLEGDMLYDQTIPLGIRGSGQTLMPFLLNANKTDNEIRGVRAV